MISILKIILSSTILLYTSYLDIKSREVEPKIWIIYGGLGGFLTLIELFRNNLSIIHIILSIGIALAIGFVSFYFGLFGGADFLAILSISITHPWPPFNPLFQLIIPYPFILTVILNSLLMSLIVPLINVTKNFRNYNFLINSNIPFKYKVFFIFLGYPIKVSKYLKMKYLFPLMIFEDLNGKLSVKYRLTFNIDEEHANHQLKLKKLIEKGFISADDVIWVTQGVPLLVFITIGYFISLMLGDVIICFVSTYILKTSICISMW